jgi:hypothetical protein
MSAASPGGGHPRPSGTARRAGSSGFPRALPAYTGRRCGGAASTFQCVAVTASGGAGPRGSVAAFSTRSRVVRCGPPIPRSRASHFVTVGCDTPIAVARSRWLIRSAARRP